MTYPQESDFALAKGKTYGSRLSAQVYNVRPPLTKYHPTTGVAIGTSPALRAEFGVLGAEYAFTAPDGTQDKAADIHGHFFDSSAWQERTGATDDERESVEAVLDDWCNRTPSDVWLHSEAPAAKPWPTYDDTHHKQVPTLAQQLGLVHEALAYEQQNKKRTEVVEKLTELINAPAVEDALTAA